MSDLPTMTELLALEPIERDIFRGRNEDPGNGMVNIYGGQIAAQALKAAGLTVDAERAPHSLHGYFLRAGVRADPVLFKVERDRDGRSFSARRVRAIQDGKVIFDLTASFHVDEDGPELEPDPRTVPPPEECPAETNFDNHPAVESRAVVAAGTPPQERYITPTLWLRARDRLGDSRLDHACALAYMSDISSGFAGSSIRGQRGGASIDHAMWFQGRARADEWMLLDMWPALAGGARGVYQGTLHHQGTSCAALFAQQALMRGSAGHPGARPSSGPAPTG